MFRLTSVLALAGLLLTAPLCAQPVGTASGKGTIERPRPSGESELSSFAPRHSYAYAEGSGAKRSTWIVLTEREPPVKAWAAATDPAEARRDWCEKEKAAFVAVKLDSEWKVDLYFLCPANGAVNTEMLSTWNGLDSVALKFDASDGKRLKGTLRTGSGSCPDAEGRQTYCTPTGDYTFDAAISK